MFNIEGYSYSVRALSRLAEGYPLHLEVMDYRDMGFREFVLMRKSIALYERLQKSDGAPSGIAPAHQAKAKAAIPSGARWITVHPNGKDEKGVPVMIQDHGDGTAHVVGGAGGRLNMLKLNNVKSKEEYRQLARERRDAERTEREAEKKAREMERAEMNPSERKVLRAQEKLRKEQEKAAEEAKIERLGKAKKEFLQSMANMLGWDDKTDAISEEYNQSREAAVLDLKQAIESEDKERIKAARKALRVIDKGYDQAMKAYEANMMQAAKGVVKDIEREAVDDESIREALEERIGSRTGAEEVIRTEKKNQGKGFATKYAESAEEKGGLTSEVLENEKEEVLQETLKRIAQESPQTAAMIAAGIATRRAVGEVKRELYERERLEGVVTDLDDKASVLKNWIAYKKVLKEEDEKKKPKQADLEGNIVDDEEKESEKKIVYGDGLAMDSEVSSADFIKEIEGAAAAMEIERQAAANGSLLDSIERNKDGAGKWLANGHYDGFNRLSLTVLKAESIPRDVVDVLGLRAGAQLLSKIMRESMDDQAFKDAAEAVQRFHAETSDDEARQASETAEELFKRADGVLGEINALKASDPDDLSALKRLNDVRMGYLDEANRVLGQTLGNLEAVAMMGSVMKQGKSVESLETNLGTISTEAAITRLRALGLTAEDYHIESVAGDRVATIGKSGVDKLTRSVNPDELALDREIEDIKRGVYDEDNWLPAGLVDRPADSFEDPGVNPDIPEGEVDNQTLGEDAVQVKNTQEAAHRALGQLPEGSIAFKALDDLTPQDQTDLRRYWESSIYTGSVAEKESVRKYQGEKGVTRAGAWQSFIAQNGGAESGAYEGIKADIAKRAPEDMFGNKETPPLLQIDPDNIETYRDSKGVTRLNGAAEIFQEIDDLESAIAEGRITESAERAERELSSKKAALPEKLKDLYRAQLQDHYHAFMSGHSESDYASAEAAGRYEGSPWNEYVRMHGGPERAHAAVLDTIKGRFIEKFADQYGKVTKKPLGTKKERISEHKGHLLGMMGKEARDSIINKVQAELSSAGAAVANRAGGKFASGSWREKALELMDKRRADDAAQGSFFDDAELKQDDGTDRLSIGKRAEAQLASMLPELSQNQLRGQKFAVSTMQAKGERQRAIKMFEKAKRMNLTFGTGKGKTIISIGAFTELHSKGKAKRAIFAVPSVVQKQFGCVAGETILSDAKTGKKHSFKEMKEKGIAPYVFSLNERGGIDVIQSSVPFIKGESIFYKVALENGSSITVTQDHKFFTPYGWMKLRDLSVGSRVFSDVSLKNDKNDALNPSLAEDCQDYCRLYYHSCGAPLHHRKDVCQSSIPSQECAGKHIQQNSLLDVLFSFPQGIRQFLGLHLPSSGLIQNLTPYVHCLWLECQLFLSKVERLKDGIYTVLQSILPTCFHLTPIFESFVHQGCNSGCTEFSYSTLQVEREPLSDLRRAGLPFQTPIGRILSSSKEPQLKKPIFCVPCRNTSIISAIVQVSIGDVYDIEVPVNHNYWLSGFWNHNSEVNVFCEPGKYKIKSNPSLTREERIEIMKDPGNHMVILTHQSIRDDMVHLMSKRMGMDEEAAKVKFNAMAEPERKAFLGETLKENGINFDMMTVDESHYTVNRKGKEDSTMANVMDALNQNVPYFMNQSATPVKNDVSEAFDFLKKVAPDRFSDRNEFMKRYGVDSDFSRDSLRRLISRYNYSSPTHTGVKRNQTKETIQLTTSQKQAYQDAEDAFRRASRAERAGEVDVEAVKVLSPNSFKGKPESEHLEIAQRLQRFSGAIKEEAFNRIVNAFDPENNAKINRLTELVESKRYDTDNAKNATKKGDRTPGVVFAHNIASVEAVRSAMEKKGLRVGVIHGAMTGDKKDEVKNGFNPPNKKDRKYDVIVLSDAGATGLNLQNAKYLVNYDLPQTSWVKEQREGRIDRHGQAHDEIDYHDLVSDTEHESKKWERIQRKSRLGSIFQQDPGAIDDTGLASYLSQVRQERINQGAV